MVTFIVKASKIEKRLQQLRNLIGTGTARIDKVVMRQATYDAMFGQPRLAPGPDGKDVEVKTVGGLETILEDGPPTSWATIVVSSVMEKSAKKSAKKPAKKSKK